MCGDKSESDLFPLREGDYGKGYKEHLLEQYKLCVEMADKISERRATANAFFLSANALLLSGLGVVSNDYVHITFSMPLTMVGVSLAGILLCFVWILLVRSYRQLNSAKFAAICAMEARLPAAPYETEWKKLRGQNESREYRPLTSVELVIPAIFIILYVLLPILTVIMRTDPI